LIAWSEEILIPFEPTTFAPGLSISARKGVKFMLSTSKALSEVLISTNDPFAGNETVMLAGLSLEINLKYTGLCPNPLLTSGAANQ